MNDLLKAVCDIIDLHVEVCNIIDLDVEVCNKHRFDSSYGAHSVFLASFLYRALSPMYLAVFPLLRLDVLPVLF